MKDPFERVSRSLLHYAFADGITELVAGLMFFWITWMTKPLPKPEMPAGALVLGYVFTIFLAAWLKRRYVYPRSGYLGNYRNRMPQMLANLGLSVLLTLFVLAPVFLFLKTADAGLSWMVLSLGVCLAGLSLYLAIRLRFWRYLFLALASAGLGLVCSPLVLPYQTYIHTSPEIPYWVIPSFQIAFSTYFILMALALVISGGITFLRYLHSNPLPAEVPDGQ